MQIAIGAYRSRSGEKATVTKFHGEDDQYPWGDDEMFTYTNTGRYLSENEDDPRDLVAPWVEPTAPAAPIDNQILAAVSDAVEATRQRDGRTMGDPVEPVTAWPIDGQGRKDDGGKNRLELFAPEMIEGISEVLTFGAGKYGDRNWERGMKWSRAYGALMRHMFAWWRGEKMDPETGKSHLWHAGCCLMFLIAYETRGTGTDDRP